MYTDTITMYNKYRCLATQNQVNTNTINLYFAHDVSPAVNNIVAACACHRCVLSGN